MIEKSDNKKDIRPVIVAGYREGDAFKEEVELTKMIRRVIADGKSKT